MLHQILPFTQFVKYGTVDTVDVRVPRVYLLLGLPFSSAAAPWRIWSNKRTLFLEQAEPWIAACSRVFPPLLSFEYLQTVLSTVKQASNLRSPSSWYHRYVAAVRLWKHSVASKGFSETPSRLKSRINQGSFWFLHECNLCFQVVVDWQSWIKWKVHTSLRIYKEESWRRN